MEPQLTWHESYAVGHIALDEEHRTLIRIINSICNLDEAEEENALAPLLQDLETATVRHFEHEDRILRSIIAFTVTEQFSPDALRLMSESVLVEHVHDHAKTLRELNLLVQSVQSSRRMTDDKICDGLKNWFFDHAIRSDAHLKSVFQAIQVERPALMSGLI